MYKEEEQELCIRRRSEGRGPYNLVEAVAVRPEEKGVRVLILYFETVGKITYLEEEGGEMAQSCEGQGGD